MDNLIKLDWVDLVLAIGLMAIAIGLSAWQRLGLEWSLAIATLRTIFQLLLVGSILQIIFELDNPWAVLAILAVMLTIAAVVARNRIGKKYPLVLPLVWGSIFLSTALTLCYTTVLIVQPAKWYNPQYLIPLAGIVFGNAINGAAIAGERFVSTINASQLEIETHLSLGATPQQAVAQYRKDAIQAGLIPNLNQMMVVGIVTLPGIITGQLLSGVNPLDAASYQILIMFMLAFANLLTAILVTQGLCRQFFNSAAQLVRYGARRGMNMPCPYNGGRGGFYQFICVQVRYIYKPAPTIMRLCKRTRCYELTHNGNQGNVEYRHHPNPFFPR